MKGIAAEIPQPLLLLIAPAHNLPSLKGKLAGSLKAFWCPSLRPDSDRQFPRAESGKNQIEVTLRQQSLLTIIFMQKQKFLSQHIRSP